MDLGPLFPSAALALSWYVYKLKFALTNASPSKELLPYIFEKNNIFVSILSDEVVCISLVVKLLLFNDSYSLVISVLVVFIARGAGVHFYLQHLSRIVSTLQQKGKS